MATVVITHGVGSLDTWLGNDNRAPLFAQFCDSYRLLTEHDGEGVSIVCEGADIAKMQELIGSPDGQRRAEEDTVQGPIRIFVEAEGAQ